MKKRWSSADRMQLAVLAIAALLAGAAAGAEFVPVMDGLVGDWADRKPIATDPAGDAEGAFDVTDVWASTAGTTVYLRLDTTRPLNLQSGPSRDGTLQIVLGLPDDDRLVIDTRRRAAHLASAPDRRLSWSLLRFAALPTHAANQYEVRIDLGGMGVEPGDEITVDLDGSDRLATPVRLVMEERAPAPAAASPFSRPDGTGLRAVSFNTLKRGLLDSDRSPALGRLLAAARADVICLQEEYRKAGIEDALENLLGGDWTLVHHDGCVVASRHPLTPLELDLGRGVAAAVELPGVGPTVVISLHLKCCGYAGSAEDRTRIDEATLIAGAIVRLRSGELGAEYVNAPVVVAGDYNLVGSRGPLRLLEAAGLRAALPIRAGAEDAITWRGLKPDESFWPGRLDLMMHGPGLEPVQAVVVDTTVLEDAVLQVNGLERNDSEASDHLMLVLDLAKVHADD